ncbi:MAG: PHP domain-containing protein [Phycisphaerae bacterium]|nr:PHP domain-containing protein [Phycisphaerae bacterium]HRS27117.1 PHP-associated domain-containing protein [Phycisphaerae bacterium]
MKLWAADLHIHTALSPCAADEMTPPAIVQAALERELSMIAICDHNAAGNAEAAAAASLCAGRTVAGLKLAVLAGMEIMTAEEVHILGIFPSPAAAAAAAKEVRATLPEATVAYHQKFGQQLVIDSGGSIVDSEPKMLAMASGFDLSAAVRLIHRHEGLAIAAHVNRPSFSVFSQLGMFPGDAGFDAIEVFTPCGDGPDASRAESHTVVAEFSKYGLPVIASSDAHYLDDVGSVRSRLRLREPSFDELVMALRGSCGRRVVHDA